MSSLRRLHHITHTAVRYRLFSFLPKRARCRLHLLSLFTPFAWLSHPTGTSGERLASALEHLGPIFIKFGQILSTRPDLFDPDTLQALSKLQDNTTPFPFERAKMRIENALKQPLSEAFQTFHETPIASASIAQVYEATRHDGSAVVVKVLRPGIEKTIRQDLNLLKRIARLIATFLPDTRRLKPMGIVNEIEQTIQSELDLTREAGNASTLKRNFADSNWLYVPTVYWDMTTPQVMVIEKISGARVLDIETLKSHGVDLKKLAERGVAIFYTQVFRDCFFHADMHPGNIFVSLEKPELAQYIAVDFGIMGSLSPEDQHYLAANFIAFFNRNYREVARLHIQSGWVDSDTRIDVLESAIRAVCEPIFEKPLGEISFGATLLHLFQIARSFNMQVQPQLLLLQKTLFNVEGLGRGLYPDLDLWANAKPFLENWMKDRLGLKGLYKRLMDQRAYISEHLPAIPQLLLQQLQQKPAASALPQVEAPIRAGKFDQFLVTVSIAGLTTSLVAHFTSASWPILGVVASVACLLTSIIR